jgi:hypothetical protein
MKWKPLIASFVVIAVALGAMAVWSKLAGEPDHGANSPTRGNTAGVDSGEDGGLTYEATPFEKLPPMDPPGLWPYDGYRMAAAEFWVMWETNSQSPCRLLATKDRRDWYNLGRTSGQKHFLQADLGFFDSRATFAVEFEANGTRYRSKPRTVAFGKGASFGQRRYKFTLGKDPHQTWDLELTGRDATELSQEAFLTTMFPQDLVTFVMPPQAADTVTFGVNNADVLKTGCAGFLEVYDARTRTYDRVLIELTR